MRAVFLTLFISALWREISAFTPDEITTSLVGLTQRAKEITPILNDVNAHKGNERKKVEASDKVNVVQDIEIGSPVAAVATIHSDAFSVM
ncbi:hypothetical protein C8J57DRAFT_1522975 [Mycena rebaudengoi]|nr:hypothetical protein C8J57DRAFT_1522975 [Mycena rebaudengoi]